MLKSKALIVVTIFVFSILFNGTVNLGFAENPTSYEIKILASKKFVFVNETINLTISGLPSQSFVFSVYNPVNEKIFERTYKLNATGFREETFMVLPSYLLGLYKFTVFQNFYSASCFCDYVSTIGLQITSFPFVRIHKNIVYNFTAKSLTAFDLSSNESLTFNYPDLPLSFDSVTTRFNGMMLTTRIIKASITIDFTYLFLYCGLKLVINGSKPSPSTYSFQFSDLGGLNKYLDSVRKNHLVFDYSDVRNAKQTFSFNKVTGMLTVTIPSTFMIDPIIFSDGFETGDTSAWAGTTITSGETIGVSSTSAFQGSYGLKSECDASAATETSYVYTAAYTAYPNEIYARAYFRLNVSSLQDAGDEVWFIRIQANVSTATSIFWGGVRQNDGHLRFCAQESVSFKKVYGTQNLTANTWYCVELYGKVSDTVGAVVLWVNGVLDCNRSNVDTYNPLWGYISSARFGIGSTTTNNYKLRVDTDCCVLSDAYIGTMPYVTFYFKSGSAFYVNGASVANGTQTAYCIGTKLALMAIISSSYAFYNFTWTGNYNASNPSIFDVAGNNTIWLYASIVVGPPNFIHAIFNWTVGHPNYNETITFDGSYSNSSSSITDYSWDFGDSNVTHGNYPTITHFYSLIGNYTVVLTITSSVGTSTLHEMVVVGQSSTVSPIDRTRPEDLAGLLVLIFIFIPLLIIILYRRKH